MAPYETEVRTERMRASLKDAVSKAMARCDAGLVPPEAVGMKMFQLRMFEERVENSRPWWIE